MSEEVKANEDIKEETTATETPAEEVKEEVKTDETPQSAPYQRRPQASGESSGQDRPQFQRNVRFKRKVCKFCYDKNLKIDYKNVKMLEQFITDRGKILPRRVTGTCAKHQRGVAIAIKRARIIALIPFVEQ
jgi:small subunit ribosomal protein S18